MCWRLGPAGPGQAARIANPSQSVGVRVANSSHAPRNVDDQAGDALGPRRRDPDVRARRRIGAARGAGARIRGLGPLPAAPGRGARRVLLRLRSRPARTRPQREAYGRARHRRAHRCAERLARRGRARAARVRGEFDGLPDRDRARRAPARSRRPARARRPDGRPGEAWRPPPDLRGHARDRARADVAGRARRSRRGGPGSSRAARGRPVGARRSHGGSFAVDRPARRRRARRTRRVCQPRMGRAGCVAATTRSARSRSRRAARRPLQQSAPRRRHRRRADRRGT